MGLRDALEANSKVRRGPACKIGLILGDMTPEDREDLEVALADIVFPGTGIARALQSEGYEVSTQMIQRHRRGDCGCPA